MSGTFSLLPVNSFWLTLCCACIGWEMLDRSRSDPLCIIERLREWCLDALEASTCSMNFGLLALLCF